MKRNHKAIILAIACALTVSLCACGAKDDVEVTETPVVDAADESTIKTGVVIDASMHNLTIEAQDGTTYLFITDDETEFDGESENLGDTVSVKYEGEYAENTLAKSVKVIEKADKEVSDSAEEVKETKKSNTSEKKDTKKSVKYITGTVKDASMHNVTVEWGGKDYSVKKTDKTSVEGDIEVGKTVRVYHTGDMADGIEAIDISVVDEKAEKSGVKYITGKVVDAAMNSIVIENNGHKYSVKKTDDTKSDSVEVGDTVRVYHKGGFSDGMTATSIVKQ